MIIITEESNCIIKMKPSVNCQHLKLIFFGTDGDTNKVERTSFFRLSRVGIYKTSYAFKGCVPYLQNVTLRAATTWVIRYQYFNKDDKNYCEFLSKTLPMSGLQLDRIVLHV
jgi:hypothetical protein